MPEPTDTILLHAQERIALQQQALELVKSNLNEEFIRAVKILASAQKVVTTGLGKSGFIARKLAATLNSLRVPAVYLHPVDALHGDSGMLLPGDCLVAFSKSGETLEILRFTEHVRALGIHVVAITSRPQSSLAVDAQAALEAAIVAEMDALDIVPTASTTSALVLADILALATAESIGDPAERLRQSHPQGSIGIGILRTVDDVMHTGERLPVVPITATLTQALAELTAKGLGAVCVVGGLGELVGLLTDGDVRRLVQQGRDVASLPVSEVMTTSPISVEPGTTLHEALRVMERRERQISVVPVVTQGHCLGILRVHDIVRVNL